MHSPQIRATLERCRSVVADAHVTDELRQLAHDLLNYLLEMHEGHRLNPAVLLIALDSLELVPGLEDCVADLRVTAGKEQQR